MPTTQDRSAERPRWRWERAAVDRQGDHLALFHVDVDEPIAIVGPPSDHTIPVEFLVTADLADEPASARVDAVRRELDYFLVELGESDPWGYAIYHAGTASNIYGSVTWSWHPAGFREDE